MEAQKLDRELRGRLMRIGRLRGVVRGLTVAVYTAVLCWIAACVRMTVWGGLPGAVAADDTALLVGGFFIGFLVLHFLLLYSLTTLKERETTVMRTALRRLFPDACYVACGAASRALLEESALFELFQPDGGVPVTTGYGSIDFRDENGTATIYDIGVVSGGLPDRLGRLPMVGWLLLLYRSIVRPIFGAPIESSPYAFRGMFGTHTSARSCRGRVILLPDGLERKIGYSAHSIQARRRKHGARLVVLEDVAFEQLFAVYADDEIEARKLLTPATMERITALRHAFGRELFLSFCGDRIYYAVPFSGGFLPPSRRSLHDGRFFEQLYREICLGRSLLSS